VESRSYTEAEALKNNLIDGLAANLGELTEQFDGKTIQRFSGESVQLKLRGEPLEALAMSHRQRLLSAILNPNIALILGLIGLVALYIEFTHTGLILPGIVGAVCVFLALVAFNLLPVNFLGVALIFGAIILFVLEAKITSYGVLAVLGIVAMIIGSLILVDSPLSEMRVSLWTAVGITLPFAAITIFLLRLVILSHQKKSVTGKEGMVGELALALDDFFGSGKVQVHGEIWQATSSEPIQAGESLRVVAVEGLKVKVEKVKGK